MPLLWDAETCRQSAHRSPIASAVQSVEHTIGARGAEEFRELSPLEAAHAFFSEFDRVLARIRTNEQVLQGAQLVHGPDGVLRAPAVSSNNNSETLREGGPR